MVGRFRPSCGQTQGGPSMSLAAGENRTALKRRDFLKTTAAGLAGVAVGPMFRNPAWAQTAASAGQTPTTLRAVKRTLEINGKPSPTQRLFRVARSFPNLCARPASAFGLIRDDGARGGTLQPGQNFNVALGNELSDPTLVHWHGLTPPCPMDGVPDSPVPALKPGETRIYAFPVADPRAYWMHAHT